jgi:hypothetical protein
LLENRTESPTHFCCRKSEPSTAAEKKQIEDREQGSENQNQKCTAEITSKTKKNLGDYAGGDCRENFDGELEIGP